MNFTDYQTTIKKLFYDIDKIEIDTIHKLSFRGKGIEQNERMSQEQFDYSIIYEQLKEILMPSIEYYSYLHNDNMRLEAEKVFFVAICEMIKQDYNRGMLITFRNVTGQTEININRYYDLLQRVSDSQDLTIEKTNGRRLFEKTYILETGIPKNLTKYVIRMFRIYWRYFREIDVNDRRSEIHQYLFGEELSQVYIVDPQDAQMFEDYRNCLKDFPEKAIRVFDKLDNIFSALDDCTELISNEEHEELFDAINDKVGFDISTVLRDSDLMIIYYSYLQQIPVNKFLKILNNLPKNELVILPEGNTKKVENINDRNVCCGVFKIRGNRYYVVVDPVISLDDIISMNCNQIIQLAKDYYCYISRNEFEVEYDGRKIQPRRMYYKGQERNIWFGRLAPANVAYVDGHKIVSSELYKRSLLVNKYFDYDKRESRLQIKINSIKVNYSDYKFKKLTFSINDSIEELIAVGDSQGKFYREGISIPVNEKKNYDIKYFVNGNSIFSECIELKDNYLFDKWNGTEYYTDSKNSTHSGSFIYFSSATLDQEQLVYDTEVFYQASGYYVYEFNVKSSQSEIQIGQYTYVFERAGKPSIYICSEDGGHQYYDEPDSINFRVVNLDEDSQYSIYIENEYGRKKYSCGQREYNLWELHNDNELIPSGYWNISIWEKQRKLDDVSFILIPKLRVEQQGICMEGKDVYINISSDEECFTSSVGGYCDSILANIGQAELLSENDNIKAANIEYYVYLDKYEICKSIVFNPFVWSFRVKDMNSEKWEVKQQVAVNTAKPNETQIAILSNAELSLFVNGKEKNIKSGVNEIGILNTIGLFKKRNEIVVTDGINSWKEIVTCNTYYKFKGISCTDETVITIQYNGPISENLIIRYFINDVLEKNIYKETFKNNFLIHVLLGSINKLEGKRVTVDIKNETVNVPTGIYDDVIVLEGIQEVKDTEKVVTQEKIIRKRLDSIASYINVDNLKTLYYSDAREEKISFSLKKIRDLIGGLNEDKY